MHGRERKEAGKRAALLFGLVAALGVALFHFRSGFSLADDSAVLIPYISVVIAAAFFAVAFSGWYFKETGLFELIVTPILVMLCAALLAGQLYALSHLLWQSLAPSSLADLLAFGVYLSFIYLYVSAPVVIPMAAAVSFILWRRYRLAE